MKNAAPAGGESGRRSTAGLTSLRTHGLAPRLDHSSRYVGRTTRNLHDRRDGAPGRRAGCRVARRGSPSPGRAADARDAGPARRTACWSRPLSWDHHWGQGGPGIALLAGPGAHARGIARPGWWTSPDAPVLVLGTWPQLWSLRQPGLARSCSPVRARQFLWLGGGDDLRYREYRWRGSAARGREGLRPGGPGRAGGLLRGRAAQPGDGMRLPGPAGPWLRSARPPLTGGCPRPCPRA